MDKVTFFHPCFSVLVSEDEKNIAPHVRNGSRGLEGQPVAHLCSPYPLQHRTDSLSQWSRAREHALGDVRRCGRREMLIPSLFQSLPPTG